MQDPLHQFEIKKILPIEFLGIDFSFTNSSLTMSCASLLVFLMFYAFVKNPSAIPGRFQMFIEIVYNFIRRIAVDNIGVEGERYVGILLGTFLFILFGNLIGMIPYSFTFTSHIIVNFTLAFILFLYVFFLGIKHHGFHFFSYFFPKGTPIVIAPFVGAVELISFFSRPISMSLRLFANMIAGHIMLKIFASFTASLGIFGFLPLALNVALTGFEILVAGFQAYIFTVLLSLYLHDAIHLH